MAPALSREVRPKGAGWKTWPEIRAQFKDVPGRPLRAILRDRKRFEKFTGFEKGERGLNHQNWYRPVVGTKGF